MKSRTVLATAWTRRTWLGRNVAALIATTASTQGVFRPRGRRSERSSGTPGGARPAHGAADPGGDREALAKHAVDAALHAGAQYADARITRFVYHNYPIGFGMDVPLDWEKVGIGVRALVDGAWGFAAWPDGGPADVAGLARHAVALAKMNAPGATPVTLSPAPAAVGRWTTPIAIDPFTVTIEEKIAFIRYWEACAARAGLAIIPPSNLTFGRLEKVLATSDGGLVTQTTFESGGLILVANQGGAAGLAGGAGGGILPIRKIAPAGLGWEYLLHADIPGQLAALPEKFRERTALQDNARPAVVGRYTLVCDGATMAALTRATLGVATQLDRALGYEANGVGTSFLNDPLAMLGSFRVAAPGVTVTANRSAPAQLATVRWDDEGVVPAESTLVNDGVLVDFQTTREQADWLAPYYAKHGKPVQSRGYAAAPGALDLTMQHMPNLALEPGAAAVRLDDLIADVPDGILVEGGEVTSIDFQATSGLLAPGAFGMFRQIKHGRLGALLEGYVAIRFSTIDLWKHVTALGGPATRAVVSFAVPDGMVYHGANNPSVKGDPLQAVSQSAQGVAAIVANQPMIDLRSKV